MRSSSSWRTMRSASSAAHAPRGRRATASSSPAAGRSAPIASLRYRGPPGAGLGASRRIARRPGASMGRMWETVRWIHLLAMAFFVGGQLVLAAVVVPVLRGDRARLRDAARRFATGTLVALALLI